MNQELDGGSVGVTSWVGFWVDDVQMQSLSLSPPTEDVSIWEHQIVHIRPGVLSNDTSSPAGKGLPGP